MERIKQCRICGCTDLKTVVNLGEQCLGGHFPRIGTPDPPLTPLELVQCMGDCGLVQLAHDIPLDLLYGSHYGYLSGLNQLMKKHLEGIAKEVESLIELWNGDVVIDIGSNDGSLLKGYRNKTIVQIGFDTAHFEKYYKDTSIVFIPGFFRPYGVKARVITSIAMFYDLPDPNRFVADIKKTLAPEGIWILEQSYLPAMISKNAFDTICHEHIEYYCLKQFKYLFDQHGLKIFNAVSNGSNGGSIRLYVCHKESKRQEMILPEEQPVDFKQFNRNIQQIRNRVISFLNEQKKQGKTIHLYGASTKGNVLLQYMGIDYRLVSMAVDVNKEKNGCWTPGTHIPIFNKEILPPDYYLVLPWHFKEGFLIQLKDYLLQGGQIIFPLPKPMVVSKDGERELVI